MVVRLVYLTIFVSTKCVFESRPMKIAAFLRKNGYTPKRVVDFPLERDTFRNKIMEVVEDFACEAKFLHFFIFHHFSFFFIYSFCSFFLSLPFSIFSLFSFFDFFDVSSFSSLYIFFPSFFFFFSGLLEIRFFLASITSRFLVTFLRKKCLSRLGVYLFGPFFLFFLISFFSFFLFFLFSFFF